MVAVIVISTSRVLPATAVALTGPCPNSPESKPGAMLLEAPHKPCELGADPPLVPPPMAALRFCTLPEPFRGDGWGWRRRPIPKCSDGVVCRSQAPSRFQRYPSSCSMRLAAPLKAGPTVKRRTGPAHGSGQAQPTLPRGFGAPLTSRYWRGSGLDMKPCAQTCTVPSARIAREDSLVDSIFTRTA